MVFVVLDAGRVEKGQILDVGEFGFLSIQP